MLKQLCLLLAASILPIPATAFASGPSFHPDITMNQTNFSDWHILGQAAWHAEGSELVGVPRHAEGGWLVLDDSYQDIMVLKATDLSRSMSGVLAKFASKVWH